MNINNLKIKLEYDVNGFIHNIYYPYKLSKDNKKNIEYSFKWMDQGKFNYVEYIFNYYDNIKDWLFFNEDKTLPTQDLINTFKKTYRELYKDNN